MRLTALCWIGLSAVAACAQPLCVSCHREIAASYARTGMARSFGRVRPERLPAELTSGAYEHKLSGQLFTISVRNGRPYLDRGDLASPIDYWFGSGDRARTYARRTILGSLLELPVSWYAEGGGTWAMSPAYDRRDHAGFSRKITYRCLFCHNAYPDIAPGADFWDGATSFPASLPEGIDCQRCHGRGADHIAAVELGKSPAQIRDAIVNPARLAPDRQMEICYQCHLETTSARLPPALMRYGRGVFSYRPGEPLEDYALHFDRAGHDDGVEVVGSAYRLRQSPCFLASAGALTCTTCHNPHSAQKATAEPCQRCHAAAVAELVRTARHPASNDCLSCHMPKRAASDAPHVQVTDHFIRKSPENHPTTVAESYRGEVKLYYPARLSKPEDELYLAVAQVAAESNLERGIPRLEAAIAKYSPARGEFYYELAEAYRHAGRLDKAIANYEEACRRTPGNWRHFHSLGISLSSAGQLDLSLLALRRAQTLAPKETVILQAIGEAYSRNGKPREALAFFRGALAGEPESAEAHNGLGTALVRLGDLAAAEKSLREAVRVRPEVAAMRLNLATLLSRRGSFQEAKNQFETAIRTDPSFPEAHSSYATALAAHGDLTQARDQYQTALRLNPGLSVTRNNLGAVLLELGDADGAIRQYRASLASAPDSATTHYNLALALMRQGNSEEAEQHLNAATERSPDYFEAHLELARILLKRGQQALAEPHLRKAAASPSPRIRKTANDLRGAVLR